MAALGRWTSVDPLAEKHLEWSPYNYVLNNPLILIDPDGRQVAANSAAQRLARGPVRPGMFMGVAARGSLQATSHPMVRDIVAGSTPLVSTAQDAVMVATGRNIATGEAGGGLERTAAAIGLILPISGKMVQTAIDGATAGIRFVARASGDVLDLSINGPETGRKMSQMIGKFRRATGSRGGPAEFLDHARALAEEAFQSGTYVTGTVGQGRDALQNATIFRRGDDYLVVENDILRSYVPDASPGGIRDEYVRLGGQ